MFGQLKKKKKKLVLRIYEDLGGERRPGCRRTNVQIIGPLCLFLVLDVSWDLMTCVYELSLLLIW